MSNGFEEYVEEAQRLAENGDTEAAMEMYKAYLSENPTSEDVRREVINLALRDDDYQQAIVEYFDWAEACQAIGSIDDAIRIYEEILVLDTHLQKKSFLMDQKITEDTVILVQDTIQAASGAIFFNMGYLYLEKGDFDESVACLQKSMEFNPSDAKTHTLLGQVYMQKEMDKEAIGEFQEVVRLAPDEAAYAYEMLGEIFIRSGKAPQSTIVWFRNAGDLYIRHGQLDEAIRAYERILTFEPTNKDILARVGEIYGQQGMKDQAAEVYTQLAEIYNEEGLLDKVIAIYEKILEWDPANLGARDRVVEIYRCILDMDPANLTARSKLIGNLLRKGSPQEAIPEFIALSETYLEKGMRKEAFAVCKKLLELDPQNAEAHELIADIYYDQEQKENALKEYLQVINLYRDRDDTDKADVVSEKLMERFPGSKEVAIQTAYYYYEQRNYEQALIEFTKLLEEDPNNLEYLKIVLDISEKQENSDDVLIYAHKIFSLDPSRDDLQEKIIGIYEDRGEKDKLIEIYTNIISLDPARNDIRKRILAIYEDSGEKTKIIEMYKKILEEEPGRVDIRQKMIEYYAQDGQISEVLKESSILADTFLGNKEIDQAEQLYKKVLAFMPADQTIRDRLCNIYEARGDVEKIEEEQLVLAGINTRQDRPDIAFKRCRKILDLNPDDINLKIKVARMAAAAGDKEEAVSNYSDIASLYMDKKMTDSAVEVLGSILDVDEQNVEFRLKIIEVLKEQLKTDEAIRHFKILASHFLRMGQNEDAVNASREAIDLQPNDVELRKGIMELFLDGNAADEAKTFSEELINIFLANGDYDEVREVYDRMSAVYQENGEMSAFCEYRENIAQIHERQMNFPEAIEEYQTVLECSLSDSNTTDTRRLFSVISNLYFKEDRPMEAVDSYGKLVGKLYDAGKIEEAILVLEQMVEIEHRIEKWDLALEALGQVINYYSILGRSEEIISTHKKRIELYHRQKQTGSAIDEMFQLIGYHLSAGNLDLAMEQFDEASRFEPDDLQLVYRMADTLFKHEFYEQARDMYSKVLEKDSENYESMARIAIIYAKEAKLQDAVVYAKKIFSQGLIAEVIDAYKKSSGENLSEAQIHINLGLFYQEMGFIEEAILEFEDAAKDPSKLLESYNLMALCFKQEGFTDLAVKQFERAIEQQGYSEEDYLPIRYNLGETYLENSRLQEALSAFYECYMVDINYRDVSEKIQMLNEKIASADAGQSE